jgi:hypothetical protein
MAVSLLALLMSCSGTAVAASALVSGDKLIRKDSLSGDRLRFHTLSGVQVNVAKLGKVPAAKHADSAAVAGAAFTAGQAANATNAVNAANATTAANASALGGLAAGSFAPVIYAHVLADGTVDPAESKGITQAMVTKRKTSAYCFSGLPFAPKGGSATIDYAAAGNGNRELAELEIDQTGSASDCQSGETVEVSTASNFASFGPEAFYIVLYG